MGMLPFASPRCTEEHSDKKKHLKKVVDFNWFDFLSTEVNSWFNFSSGTLRHRVKSVLALMIVL